MEVLINIFIIIVLLLSLFLNYAFIMRIHSYDATFYLDKKDPNSIKPVIKFDVDEIEDKPFFIVKVLKDKERK